MARSTMYAQDAALDHLGWWPYPGRTFDSLSAQERAKVYHARLKLAKLVPSVKVPGFPRTYSSAELDKMIRLYSNAA